jgi:nitroreductase
MTQPTEPRTPTYPIDPLFLRRWSARAFTAEPIADETLRSFFEAARWAPSAYNAQPWRFVYAYRGTATFDAIFATLAPFNQTWAGRAAALALVASRTVSGPPGADATPNRWSAFDTGAAWGHLALQAALSGWAAHAMAGFDVDALRRALAVPEHYDLHAVVAIGRPGDVDALPEPLRAREAPNGRAPLASIARENEFRFDD